MLDTNVWLDWLAFEDPRLAPLAAAHASGTISILACARARAELIDVLARETLTLQVRAARTRRGLSDHLPGVIVQRFDSLATVLDCAPRCTLSCADPDDQHLIDLAVQHRVQWLLTRDRAVLALSRKARAHYGVEIAPPERLVCVAGAPPTIAAGGTSRWAATTHATT